MNSCFYAIKQKIQLLVVILNLISFIVITSITNKNKTNYIEYASISVFCSNFYIIIIYVIMLIHSVFPKILCEFITDNLIILTSDKGKMIINLSIGILFWSSNNSAHLVFSIINFVSSFALFLCELIFECNILNNKIYSKERNEYKICNNNLNWVSVIKNTNDLDINN